ncbi:recombinase family protein [Pseudoxanthomonas winnipegensis]|uniref:Recombinase family protein n=1 Tax=Pseudoxanthomonas winnipegensis TaxID=2480810 RepID=A0A4Q8LK84_9GAMM|nr:recombinase family protein [Pseudoxanthomonas winnipegensis]RZZ87899.1 recombinase family protein [Pseudoxanthomonas winnipegensis]TAA30036.1 recombinase family protein [Pseudoxanthomonas winnipegensis]TAA36560.1 recombinase family protein [Pseudoxanthomonas winnipegensis]TBV78178.1 recombinase family protein [Pseudoxanthomonas winnipegensis]
MIVGYARVSTHEQNLKLQLRALEASGCAAIFSDQGASGKLATRPGLSQALEGLEPGGKLVVWRLDRLGRSLVNLVRLLDDLGQRGIGFQSITEHIDTSSSGGRLVFHMMAALAEFEHNLISERTRAGVAAARAEGKRLGRLPSLSLTQCRQACHLRDLHAWSTRQVAEQLGIHRRTLLRHIAKAQQSGQLSYKDELVSHADCPVCASGAIPYFSDLRDHL